MNRLNHMIAVLTLGCMSFTAGVTSEAKTYVVQGEGILKSDIGTCLQAKNTRNGSSVISSRCKAGLSKQIWTMRGQEVIHRSGKCLTIRHTDKAVILYDCHGGSNQKWAKTDRALKNKLHGSCLDITKSKTADGTPVIAYTCSGNKNQAWTFKTQQKPSEHIRGRVPLVGNVLNMRDELKAGQYFEQMFQDGNYKAIMQDDCNFVVYGPGDRPVWATATHHKGQNCSTSLSVDNGVAYLNVHDGAGRKIWKSGGSNPKILDVVSPYLVIQKGGVAIEETILNGHHVRHLWSSKQPSQPSQIEKVLPNAYGKQTVSIDCLVSGADDEETGNRITVSWFTSDGRKIGSRYRNGIRTCHGANDKWTLTNSEEAAYITVNTNGSDGYLMDQIELFRDGRLVRTHGGNDSRGWCLSTDNSDHNTGNFYGHSVDSQCPPTRRFNY